MKTAGIATISAGVAVVGFILVFVGVGTNQAEKIDYQIELEETVSSESASPSTPEEQESQSIEEAPKTEPPKSEPPQTEPTETTTNCDPSYPDVCIPSPPPDLDCGEISYKNFKVVGSDPHRFDGDKDGIGCES